jgi:hypothetical protein
LLYVDIPDDDVIEGNGRSQLTWNPLLEATFQPGTLAAKVSKEEQLMLERKRLSWVRPRGQFFKARRDSMQRLGAN